MMRIVIYSLVFASLLLAPIKTLALVLGGSHCTKVIDGNTIVLEGNEDVRLIGVDTPETIRPPAH